jgi:hypothetical protein
MVTGRPPPRAQDGDCNERGIEFTTTIRNPMHSLSPDTHNGRHALRDTDTSDTAMNEPQDTQRRV